MCTPWHAITRTLTLQTDEFTLNLARLELGKLNKIEVGLATQQSAAGKVGGLLGQQWGLESVEVLHFNSKDRFFFFYDDWISADKRRVQLVPGKAGGSNTYKVGAGGWGGRGVEACKRGGVGGGGEQQRAGAAAWGRGVPAGCRVQPCLDGRAGSDGGRDWHTRCSKSTLHNVCQVCSSWDAVMCRLGKGLHM